MFFNYCLLSDAVHFDLLMNLFVCNNLPIAIMNIIYKHNACYQLLYYSLLFCLNIPNIISKIVNNYYYCLTILQT